MKKVFLAGFAGLFATVILAHLLLTRTDVLERIPHATWVWLEDLYGGFESIEEMRDMEFLASFALSFIIVSVLTMTGWFLWRRIKAR